MTRHHLLALLTGAVFAAAPLAAAIAAPEPTAPPFTIEAESFPMVTPLPPKAPMPDPSAQETEPDPVPVLSPEPTAGPVATPTPQPSPAKTAAPTPVPSKAPVKGELSYSFPKTLTEGRRVPLQLQLDGAASYPVKGVIRYEDPSYDYSKKLKEAIPFELKGPGPQTVNLIFRTPGRKAVRIETPAAPARNAAVYVNPLAATVFPLPRDSGFDKNPASWHVWVNLHHSMTAKTTQRQYYLITYRGEIVQKLLTSSAAPGKLTPQGLFKLGVKSASPTSTLYDSVMPFWTTIMIPGHSYEYGNHGLTGEAYLYHLGTPASHGCLRLSNKWVQQQGQWVNIGGAKWVYTHVPVGTKIRIFKQAIQPFAFENYTMWLSKAR